MPRNQWPLARIVEVYPNVSDKLVRHVKLYVPTSKSDLKGPINKSVLLVGHKQSDDFINFQNVPSNHTDTPAIQTQETSPTVIASRAIEGATTEERAEDAEDTFIALTEVKEATDATPSATEADPGAAIEATAKPH